MTQHPRQTTLSAHRDKANLSCLAFCRCCIAPALMWMMLADCVAAEAPTYDDPALLIVMVPYYRALEIADPEAVIKPCLDLADVFALGRYHVTLAIGVDATRDVGQQIDPIIGRVKEINARLDDANRSRSVTSQLHQITFDGYEFSTAEQGSARILQWMNGHFGGGLRGSGRRSSSGRLAFRGHGELREGTSGANGVLIENTDFLLTPDDILGTGGINLQHVIQESFDRGIATHIDWDACRVQKTVRGLPTPRTAYLPVHQRREPSPSIKGSATQLSDTVAYLRQHSRYVLSTPEWQSDVTFARFPGQALKNDVRYSLLANQALGLSLVENEDGTVPHLRAEVANGERFTKLDLECTGRELLKFAFDELGDATDYKEPVEHKYGPVDPQRVIYSRKKEYKYEPLYTNLLENATPFEQAGVSIDALDQGFSFKRGEDSSNGTRVLANLKLNPTGLQHAGFPVSDEKRWLEVLVRVPTSSASTTFCIQPAFAGGFAAGYGVDGLWKTHSVPADGKVYGCSIELLTKAEAAEQWPDFDGYMTLLTLCPHNSDLTLKKQGKGKKPGNQWPFESEVEVVGARILEAKPPTQRHAVTDWFRQVPFTTRESRDILRHWWSDATLRESDELTVFRPASPSASVHQRRVIKHEPSPGEFAWGVEGAVFPPFIIDSDYRELKMTIKRNKASLHGNVARAGIVAYSHDRVLVESVVPLEAESTTTSVKVSEKGSLRALAIVFSDCEDVTIERISLENGIAPKMPR